MIKCEEECKELGYCPYTDLYDEGLPCGVKSFDEFEKMINNKWIRYRCDNPECTSGIKGGGFFVKDGPCPYCGSKEYHSFDAHPKYLKRVIDDLIKKAI